MRIRPLVTVLVLPIAAILAVPAMGFTVANETRTQVHTVLIEGMRFQPQDLTVAAGDTVVWVNRDLVPHTATSPSGRFDSNEIAPGTTWTHTVRNTGEFGYICTYHPLMKAILRVK